jgi:recombination protein RecR
MTSERIPGTSGPVARLIEEFHRLPGIGPKSAQRLTYFLVRASAEETRALAEAILEMKRRTTFCSLCQNITEDDPCSICTNPARDRSCICVVEEPLDVVALERAGCYKGLYHVLHGAISPMNNVLTGDLRIKELLSRIQDGVTEELIIATNPNVEGEATAMYVHRIATSLVKRITRLARGLPVGGDLEYADEVTIARAVEGRQAF